MDISALPNTRSSQGFRLPRLKRYSLPHDQQLAGTNEPPYGNIQGRVHVPPDNGQARVKSLHGRYHLTCSGQSTSSSRGFNSTNSTTEWLEPERHKHFQWTRSSLSLITIPRHDHESMSCEFWIPLGCMLQFEQSSCLTWVRMDIWYVSWHASRTWFR